MTRAKFALTVTLVEEWQHAWSVLLLPFLFNDIITLSKNIV